MKGANQSRKENENGRWRIEGVEAGRLPHWLYCGILYPLSTTRYLPREEKAAMASPNEQSQEKLGQSPSSSVKILVVEDELETTEMLRTYFGFCGYEVLSTAWGRDVLEMCQESHPDLIILDIQLPDIDGYEVYQELRNTEQTSHIPVIFLTKLVDDDLRANSRETGAIDYITKPFDLKKLEQRVRGALAEPTQDKS
jgi:CheY-like chemotaxis protein